MDGDDFDGLTNWFVGGGSDVQGIDFGDTSGDTPGDWFNANTGDLDLGNIFDTTSGTATASTSTWGNALASIAGSVAQVFGAQPQTGVVGTPQPTSFLASAPLGIPMILWIAAIGIAVAMHAKKG